MFQKFGFIFWKDSKPDLQCEMHYKALENLFVSIQQPRGIRRTQLGPVNRGSHASGEWDGHLWFIIININQILKIK